MRARYVVSTNVTVTQQSHHRTLIFSILSKGFLSIHLFPVQCSSRNVDIELKCDAICHFFQVDFNTSMVVSGGCRYRGIN